MNARCITLDIKNSFLVVVTDERREQLVAAASPLVTVEPEPKLLSARHVVPVIQHKIAQRDKRSDIDIS